MYLLSRLELKALAGVRADVALSMYLPTHQGGGEAQQDRIRLKRLLGDAQRLLRERGLRAHAIDELLAPVRKLHDYSTFWRDTTNGLALFVTPEMFRYYRVPTSFEETVWAGDRFYLKPLFPIMVDSGRYYVLAVDQGKVSLYQANGQVAAEIPVEQLPADLADALKFDQPERQIQSHSAAGGGHRGRRPTIFHGHGVAEDEHRTNILRYFQQVDRVLRAVLKDDPVPLVLAGVEYLHPIYREANTYQNVLEQGVMLDTEMMRPEELAQRAWEIVRPVFHQREARAIEMYRELAGTGRTSEDLKEILPAAAVGQVQALFIAAGATQWGAFNRSSGEVELHETRSPESEDLIDAAALEAFANGGGVFSLAREEMPVKASVCALLRW